ncbi:MAG: hypothetical protein J0I84_12470 [Terrimonas sp.]|nr:hypothetical protein [Terrimonas sp.]
MKIFVDFNNADSKGRIRLNTDGTLKDIKKKEIKLEIGLEIILSDYDEFETLGVIEFSLEEKIWVARIDWNALTHSSPIAQV